MTPTVKLDLKVLPIDLIFEVVHYAIEDHLSGPMKVKITGSKWGHSCIKVSLFSVKFRISMLLIVDLNEADVICKVFIYA